MKASRSKLICFLASSLTNFGGSFICGFRGLMLRPEPMLMRCNRTMAPGTRR